MRLNEDPDNLHRQKTFDEGCDALTVEELGFVGIGRSELGGLSQVSERHDEAQGKALALRLQPKEHGVRQ